MGNFGLGVSFGLYSTGYNFGENPGYNFGENPGYNFGLYSTGSVTTLFRWLVPLFSSFFGFLNSKPMNILLLAIKLKSYLARLFKSHLARQLKAISPAAFWLFFGACPSPSRFNRGHLRLASSIACEGAGQG